MREVDHVRAAPGESPVAGKQSWRGKGLAPLGHLRLAAHCIGSRGSCREARILPGASGSARCPPAVGEQEPTVCRCIRHGARPPSTLTSTQPPARLLAD